MTSPRTVFITGASGGFGRAIAARFAALGDRLILAGRTMARLEALAAALPPVPLHLVAFDIRDRAAIEAAVAALPPEFAGVDVLTKSLAKALAPQVRVIAVSPGVVDSSFVPGRGADFNEKAAATIPLKRIGTVEDIASAIEACATTMRFATGARFVVDGGRSL